MEWSHSIEPPWIWDFPQNIEFRGPIVESRASSSSRPPPEGVLRDERIFERIFGFFPPTFETEDQPEIPNCVPGGSHDNQLATDIGQNGAVDVGGNDIVVGEGRDLAVGGEEMDHFGEQDFDDVGGEEMDHFGEQDFDAVGGEKMDHVGEQDFNAVGGEDMVADGAEDGIDNGSSAGRGESSFTALRPPLLPTVTRPKSKQARKTLFCCSFEGCRKRFKDKSLFKCHERNHQLLGDRTKKCQACKKRFSKNYLKKHQKFCMKIFTNCKTEDE